jgi:hypothetical protein
MKVYVNDRDIDLLPGMSVRHALIRAELLREVKYGKKVYDEWGNEVGLDGALSEGIRIYVKMQSANCKMQSAK